MPLNNEEMFLVLSTARNKNTIEKTTPIRHHDDERYSTCRILWKYIVLVKTISNSKLHEYVFQMTSNIYNRHVIRKRLRLIMFLISNIEYFRHYYAKNIQYRSRYTFLLSKSFVYSLKHTPEYSFLARVTFL